MAANLETIEVRVAYALPSIQKELRLQLPSSATVMDAILASGFIQEFDLDCEGFKVGVWGEVTPPDRPLKTGDRVEIYRPLLIDPMALRKRRALRQKR